MSLIPLIAGAIFFVFGLCMYYDIYRFNTTAIRTKGTITGYEEYESANVHGTQSKYYRPVFSFSVDGIIYEVTSNTSYNSRVLPVGQSTDVLYQTGREANARLAASNNPGMALFFVVLSIPALYIGIFH